MPGNACADLSIRCAGSEHFPEAPLTLFDTSVEPTEQWPQRTEAERRRDRGTAAGWILLALALIGALLLAIAPAPYVIERPGPVFDTLGEVQTGDGKLSLIDIPDETTYETEGSLDLLTVNIVGTREQPPGWGEIALAWFDSSKAVIPIDQVFPEGVTDQQSSEQSAVEMQNSQQEAIAAALRELDYDYTGVVTVAGLIPEGSPSEGVLEEGDEILAADGTELEDVTALRRLIAEHGIGTPMDLRIRRDGAARTVQVTPAASPDDGTTPIIGVFTGARYDFPFEVRIQLENVGGPSAGMMFALGIIDKLTPGAMTGGADIAGTGTIAADGTVGPIGGIRQKLHGAKGAGAEWFLAPAANCDEVVGHVPDGLTVYSVETLDDALATVEAIESDEGRDALATCTR